MGFLNRLFSKRENVVRDLKFANTRLIRVWKKYIETVPEKERIVNAVVVNIERLTELLRTELADIENEELSEEEIIKDLEYVSYDIKAKRLHRLGQTLDYGRTKHLHAYKLLEQIYSSLKYESHIVKLLSRGQGNREKLISHLRGQIDLEIIVIERIKNLNEREGAKTFEKLLVALVKEEYIIKQLDETQKRLVRRMQKIFSQEIPESVTYKWVEVVNNSIHVWVKELIDEGEMDFHPDRFFEFVNRGEFVELVRRAIQSIRPIQVSERMIDAFVHIYREGYNDINLDQVYKLPNF